MDENCIDRSYDDLAYLCGCYDCHKALTKDGEVLDGSILIYSCSEIIPRAYCAECAAILLPNVLE